MTTSDLKAAVMMIFIVQYLLILISTASLFAKAEPWNYPVLPSDTNSILMKNDTNNNEALLSEKLKKLIPKTYCQVIPTRLRNLGLKLFENEQRFNAVLSNMSTPVSFNIRGEKIILVQNKHDGSVSKMQNEFSHGLDGYGFSRIGVSNYGTMIDIGANIGCMSIYIAKIYPNWRIISFEPAPVTYFYFQYNMFLNNITAITGLPGRNKSGGIRAINSAVGSRRATMEFTYSDYDSQLATFSDVRDGVNGWHKVNITVVSVTNIFARFNLDVIDFFKIDCEGCEFEVIPSIHSHFINKKKMRFVGAEIHQSLMPQLKRGDDDPLARRPNATAVTNLMHSLESRGCSSKQWTTKC